MHELSIALSLIDAVCEELPRLGDHVSVRSVRVRVGLARTASRHRAAALVGDLATECDADRLRRSGAPVRQITTGTVCHLDADMLDRALEGWPLQEVDFLFIENVGNLVCPASYDLGEHLRVVLVSVTEGEDKPLKYPTIFNTADLAVVTKLDLAAAVDFDRAALLRNIESVRPALPVLEVSAKTGDGLSPWLEWLDGRAAEARSRVSTLT
jgi:hydrogenase nickel incorporation protein HypB